MSSPNKLKAFLIAGILETSCSPFLALVEKDCELKSFKSSIVSFLTVLSVEIICIAKSIYISFLSKISSK